MEKLFITKENLKALTGSSNTKGYKVIGLNKQNRFATIKDGEEFVIGSLIPPSKISMKEFFFPKTESLFYFEQKQQYINIIDPEPVSEKTLVVGVKPCDAAALPILSKVFNWDYKDDFFNDRVNNSVVIGTACQYRDEYCFCESVGLDQNNTKGSDLFLTPLENGSYRLDIITEKGKQFAEEIKDLLSIGSPSRDDELNPGNNIIAGSSAQKERLQSDGNPASSGQKESLQINANPVPSTQKESLQHNSAPSSSALAKEGTYSTFNYVEVKQWLDNNFEHSFWNEAGEMCLGCAQCGFACPTCHCFDIVDEQNGSCAGRRAKNWDACQFSLFTKHASGHNPRDNQDKRYRQRINHKFKYYMDKFDDILCTGCGRCTRGCPVSTDILQILQDINSLQKSNSN